MTTSVSSSQPLSIQSANGSAVPIAALPRELFPHIFFHLNPGSVGQASQVCKVFNAASKDSNLWKNLFVKYLPGIIPLEEARGDVSIEKQLKAVYKKRVTDPRAAIRKEIKALWSQVKLLRGTNGFNGEINDDWKKYDEFKNAYDKFSSALKEEYAISFTLRGLKNRYENCKANLTNIVGPNYDGTEQSITPKSLLGEKSRYLQISDEQRLKGTQEAFEDVVSITFALEILQKASHS